MHPIWDISPKAPLTLYEIHLLLFINEVVNDNISIKLSRKDVSNSVALNFLNFLGDPTPEEIFHHFMYMILFKKNKSMMIMNSSTLVRGKSWKFPQHLVPIERVHSAAEETGTGNHKSLPFPIQRKPSSSLFSYCNMFISKKPTYRQFPTLPRENCRIPTKLGPNGLISESLRLTYHRPKKNMAQFSITIFKI